MGQASGLIRQRCAVVLVHEGQLLVLRQNGRPFWVLPGGTLEHGETLTDCAARELCEEAGLLIEVGPMISVSDFIDPAGGRHVVDYVFMARYLDGPTSWSAPYPENIDDMRWVSREELAELTLRPDPVAGLIRHVWRSDNPDDWHWPQDAAGAYLGCSFAS